MPLNSTEWSAIQLSFVFALAAATLGLVPATGVGYWLARSRSKCKWIVEAVVQLPLVLPPVVTGYLLLVLLSPRGPIGGPLLAWWRYKLVFTPLAAVLAALIVSLPLSVRALRLAMQGVDTRLEGAARTLGRRPAAVFVTVTLPLAKRGLIAAWLLAFARSLGEFGATIMVAGNIAGATQTIPLAVFSMASQPGGIDRAWPLVAVSIALSTAALAAAGLLDGKVRPHAT